MRSLLLCLLLPVLVSVAPTVHADENEFAGQMLADYLDELNDQGQTVLFSSDLVTDDMRLQRAPVPRPSLLEMQAILRPFGLTATPGPANSLLIVAMDEPPVEANQSGTVTLKAAPIPEIVVTSSLHRLDYTRPSAQTYLDRELVSRIPTTADDVVRVTHRLPGTATGGVSARNHIRGGEANEVLFLFDGLRLYEPYHLKDFQAITTIINANAIGGMDFYTGAYPAHFGDRMSGVLSVELREPEKPIATELAVSFFNASLLSIGTFGDADQGDWLVSARRGNLDLIIDVVDPEFGSPDYQDYLAHVGWEFNPRAQVSANFLISDDKLSLVDADRGERAAAAYSNQVGWLKWRAQWSESLSSDSILAISDIGNRRSGVLALPGIVSGSLRENREFSALEVRQDWRWVAAETWMLRFGFNIKDLDAKYQLISAKTVEPPFDAILDNQPATIQAFDLAPSGVQYAAYTELRSRPFDNWTFDVGLRWDQQNYTAVRNDKQYSPRLGILYQPAEDSELRLGWGQYYQAQEINELQVSDGIAEFFRAQQAEHFVLNIKHQYHTGLNAEISVYHKSFRRLKPRFENAFNTLTLLPELQFDRIMVDPSGAEAVGAELLLSKGSATDDLLWWIGYAWSKIEDETNASDVLRGWDQTHSLKGGLSWRWGQWDFSAAAEVHTGWPRTVMTGELVPHMNGSAELILEVEDRNASRYSAFHTLDIRVSREFDLARGDLTAFFDFTNVFDQQNPCCVEYSLQADGSLASTNKHWLPMVPSLGIVWRF